VRVENSNLSPQRHRVTEKSSSVALCKMLGEIQTIGAERLVFQRHHGLVATAESGDMLEFAVGLSQQHDRTVAEYGMTGFGHVPNTALARVECHGLTGRHTRRRVEPGAWLGQCQE
jgi:hypothetical protein